MARLGGLLTWRRARAYALTLGAVYVVSWLFVALQGNPPLNRSGEPMGGDFIAFYAAGRAILEGQAHRLYDPALTRAIQDQALGGTIANFYDPFRNPPFFALPYVPLAALDLMPAAGAWALLSVGFLAVALALIVRVVPSLRSRWRGLAILTFAFGPVYYGLINGENSTLSLLLYVLIYRAMLRGREREVGVWAALGLFKPQLFFLMPLVFLASRRWQALGAYAATGTLLGLGSLALVGLEGAQGWFQILVGYEAGNAEKNAWRMHSLKTFFDLLLPGQPGLAWGLFGAAMLGVLALVARAWWTPAGQRVPEPGAAVHGSTSSPRTGDPDGTVRPEPVEGPVNDDALALRFAFTILAGLLVNLHLVDYDLTVLVLAGALVIPAVPSARWIALALYVLLLVRELVPLGPVTVQPTVPVLAGAAWILWRRLSRPRPAELPERQTTMATPMLHSARSSGA